MPNPKPNLAGLRMYHVKKREETIEKVTVAVKILRKATKPINFKIGRAEK